MKNPACSLKVDTYAVLSKAVEEGLEFGWGDKVKAKQAIMDAICEYFDFETSDNFDALMEKAHNRMFKDCQPADFEGQCGSDHDWFESFDYGTCHGCDNGDEPGCILRGDCMNFHAKRLQEGK